MLGAVLGIGSMIIGGIGASNAASKQANAQANQLAWEQEQYQESKDWFTNGAQEGFDKAVDTLKFGAGGCASAALATAYDAQSYDMKSFMSEAYKTELDGFVEAFKDAENMNNLSMDTFNRRYGQVMDNVRQSILDVSQERLAASGREQLALDAKTLSQNFDQEMARKGMNRSGMSVEMENRMAMEVSKQARAIDVNSYAQANQMQAQGVQALNSMTAQEQQIAQRGENLQQNKAQGILNAKMQDANLLTQTSNNNAARQQQASQVNATNRTNVSMTNASNRTNVSMTNATNKTNVAMNNARIASSKQLALAKMYSSKWDNANAFYAGNPGAGVSSAYGAQATQAGQDAAGWGSVAGWGAEKAFDKFSSNTSSGSGTGWAAGLW